MTARPGEPTAAAAEPLDCRSDDGIIVGLIDGMIAQARIVARHLREHKDAPQSEEVREALADIRGDADVQLVTDWDTAGGQIRW